MFEAGTVQTYKTRLVRKFRADFFVPVFPILLNQGLLKSGKKYLNRVHHMRYYE